MAPTGTCTASASINFTYCDVKDNQSAQLQRVTFEKAVREVVISQFPAVDPSVSISFSFAPPITPVNTATLEPAG